MIYDYTLCLMEDGKPEKQFKVLASSLRQAKEIWARFNKLDGAYWNHESLRYDGKEVVCLDTDDPAVARNNDNLYDELAFAILDLCDGLSIHDIVACTGLPFCRCQEIVEIYKKLLVDKDLVGRWGVR